MNRLTNHRYAISEADIISRTNVANKYPQLITCPYFSQSKLRAGKLKSESAIRRTPTISTSQISPRRNYSSYEKVLRDEKALIISHTFDDSKISESDRFTNHIFKHSIFKDVSITARLFFNHTNPKKIIINNINKEISIYIWIISKINIIWKQIKNLYKARNSIKNTFLMFSILKTSFSIEFFLNHSKAMAIIEFIKVSDISIIFIPFEGHFSENLLIYLLNELSPDTIIVLNIHSLPSKSQFVNYEFINCQTDLIISKHFLSKKILFDKGIHTAKYIHQEEIIPLEKSDQGRFIINTNSKKTLHKWEGELPIGFFPEGFQSEETTMAEFYNYFKSKNVGSNCFIKFHPDSPRNKDFPKSSFCTRFASNMGVSKNNLTGICFYRGSSISVDLLLKNWLPIFIFTTKEEVVLDSLWFLSQIPRFRFDDADLQSFLLNYDSLVDAMINAREELLQYAAHDFK